MGGFSFWLRRWDLNLTTSGLWARRATRLLYSAISNFIPRWCRWPGSNRYDTFVSRDFKSRASACSATPANCLSRLCYLSVSFVIIPYLHALVNPFTKILILFSFFIFLTPRLPYFLVEKPRLYAFLRTTSVLFYLSSLKYGKPSPAGGWFSFLFLTLVTINTSIVTI